MAEYLTYEEAANSQTRKVLMQVLIDGIEVPMLSVSFFDERESLMSGFTAKRIEFEFDAKDFAANLNKNEVNVNVGFEGFPEFKKVGTFYVDGEDVELDEIKKIYKVTAYDLAVNFDKKYQTVEDGTGLEIITEIANRCGVVIGDISELQYNNTEFHLNINNDETVSYRQVISKYAELHGGFAYIDENNQLSFKRPLGGNVAATLDGYNYTDLKLTKDLKPVNAVVFNEGDVEDPLYIRNDISIEEHGITEFKLGENPFVTRANEELIMQILQDRYDDLEVGLNLANYTPFESTAFMRPDLHAGDKIIIKDVDDVEYTSYIQNINWTWNGGLKGTMSCDIILESKTDYTLSSEQQRIIDMGVKVNRVEETITSFIEVEDENSKKLTSLTQTVENFSLLVKDGGGSNLLKNSVGYKGTEFWTSAGTVEVSSSQINGTSKHSFYLKVIDEVQPNLKQFVTLKPNTDYCLKALINAKIDNGVRNIQIAYTDEQNVEQFQDLIRIVASESYEGEVTLNFTTGNWTDVRVEVWQDATNTEIFEVSDLGLYEGHNVVGWQQFHGETYTLNVQVDEQGLTVYSTDKKSKTVMSPEEFSGYYNDEKIFTLNGSITEVQGLSIKKEGLHIAPIKMIRNDGRKSLVIVWTGGV